VPANNTICPHVDRSWRLSGEHGAAGLDWRRKRRPRDPLHRLPPSARLTDVKFASRRILKFHNQSREHSSLHRQPARMLDSYPPLG
jgi:hypothetical protein